MGKLQRLEADFPAHTETLNCLKSSATTKQQWQSHALIDLWICLLHSFNLLNIVRFSMFCTYKAWFIRIMLYVIPVPSPLCYILCYIINCMFSDLVSFRVYPVHPDLLFNYCFLCWLWLYKSYLSLCRRRWWNHW